MAHWVLAFHIIFVICWFAGLFYLPRLFVYHAVSHDVISDERFKIMEHKLFWWIMTPAGLLTSITGLWLFLLKESVYMQDMWMHAKFVLVGILWCYHFYCGYLLRQFQANQNTKSSTFYRVFNEVPTLLLIAIVILVVVKP